MARAFHNLIDPLISYTCETFNEITPQKLGNIRLTYEIIREAISDLHGKDETLRQDAKDYFNSEVFKYDCECVGISETLMLYIAFNPDKHLKHMSYNDDYNEPVYESNI